MSSSKAKEKKVSVLLKEKFVNLKLTSKTKKEVIAELVELVGQSKKIKNKKALFEAILERESLGSTGIGCGVAIPHAKTKVAGDFILAFARKDEGLDFGALDGEKTYLFFMLASPKEDIGGHLKILAEISRIAKDKFTVDLLRHTKDKKDVLKIIANAQKHFM